MISVEQAHRFLLERARQVRGIEEVDIDTSLGRILAETLSSPIDVPGHDNSAMDGYAVRSADIPPDGEAELPVRQRVPAGVRAEPLKAGTAARIFTGGPIPRGADAVVMQERCRAEAGSVRIPGPVAPGQNTRPRGNDIAAGEEILAAGTRLRPQEMGLAASVGLGRLRVFRQLRAAIFSSGDELVSPGNALGEGKIFNSNRYTLVGLLKSIGCEVVDFGTVADDFDATCRVLDQASREADVVVTSGGVSVGEEDHVKRAVESTGHLDFWRIAVKPGKPFAYGRIGDADFLGLPGNPVSVFVIFCLFARPFLLRRQGAINVLPLPMRVRGDFHWKKRGDRREYARARLNLGDDGELRATLFPKQGSDVLTSAVWAQGLVEIPADTVFAPGDTVNYLSFSDLLG